MKNGTDSAAKPRRWLTAGKWVLMSYSLAIVLILVLTVLLLAQEIATGRRVWQLPTSGLWRFAPLAFFAYMFVAIMSWMTFLLMLVMTLRRSLGADSVRQSTVIACLAIPFWGSIYYARILEEIAATPSGGASQPAHAADAAVKGDGGGEGE